MTCGIMPAGYVRSARRWKTREVLLGHADYSMAGHCANAVVGRLLKQANLLLNGSSVNREQ